MTSTDPLHPLGGLLIDFNLLVPKIPSLLTSFDLPVPTTLPTLLEVPPLDPSHSAVVELRAVTIIMLDRLAEGIRKKTGVAQLSLPQVLEAGTWKAVSCQKKKKKMIQVRDGADPSFLFPQGREIAKKLRPETSGPPFRYG